MIVSGGSISGLTFSGDRTLASIGDVIWWTDYRRMVTVSPTTERVTRWGTLASNYNISQFVEVPGQGPRLYAGEGIGWKGPVHGSPGPTNFRAPKSVFVQRFHSGDKYALFAVVFKDNNGSTANESTDVIMIRNSADTSFSFLWRPIVRQGFQLISINGESDQQNSALSNNQYTLVGVVYYGPNKSDNLRFVAGNSQQLATNEIAMPVDNHSFARYLQLANWANTQPTHLVKMVIAYNLNERTDDNINDVFLPLFFETLKKDSEYSTIVTP